MNYIYSLCENIGENEKKLISDELGNILDDFPDKSKYHVSELVVVSRTRFFKLLSNYGEFLLLESSSRVINSYENILLLLHKAKIFERFFKCLQIKNDNLNIKKNFEKDILMFINYLEEEKKKHYDNLSKIMIKFIITAVSKNNSFLENKLLYNELENKTSFDTATTQTVTQKEEKAFSDSNACQSLKINDSTDDIWKQNSNTKDELDILIEPFNELEDYEDYLFNILNKMDSTSWKDKKHEEYLKMISLNDEMVHEDDSSNSSSASIETLDNNKRNLSNITKIKTNNTLLLPKHLKNVRNSIYSYQSKSKMEVKYMVEQAMSDNLKTTLFKTGKIKSEMIPSPNYVKYWPYTNNNSLSRFDDSALMPDMILKFFNIQNSSASAFKYDSPNNANPYNASPYNASPYNASPYNASPNCTIQNNVNTRVSPFEYHVNYYDIMKLILKGINAIPIENEEINMLLTFLSNRERQNYYLMNNNKNNLVDMQFDANSNNKKYNYSILPLDAYSNTNKICKEILKYAISNHDLVLTLKTMDTFLELVLYKNSLKDIVYFLNTIGEYIIIPYLTYELNVSGKNRSYNNRESSMNQMDEINQINGTSQMNGANGEYFRPNIETWQNRYIPHSNNQHIYENGNENGNENDNKNGNENGNESRSFNYTNFHKVLCRIPLHEYQSLQLLQLYSLHYPMFFKINDKPQRCLKNCLRPCEYYSNTLPTYGSYIFQFSVVFEIDNSIKVLDEHGSKCKILFQLSEDDNDKNNQLDIDVTSSEDNKVNNFLEINFIQNHMYTKIIKHTQLGNNMKEKEGEMFSNVKQNSYQTNDKKYSNYIIRDKVFSNDNNSSSNYYNCNNTTNKHINVYDVTNMNTIVFDILVDQGCYNNDSSDGNMAENDHTDIVIYSNGKYLLSTCVKKGSVCLGGNSSVDKGNKSDKSDKSDKSGKSDNDKLVLNNSIRLKVFTSRTCVAEFPKEFNCSSTFVNELINRKLILDNNKNFLLKNHINIIEFYNKVSTALNRYIYRFYDWNHSDHKNKIKKEYVCLSYNNVDIYTFEVLIKFIENNNKILRRLSKLARSCLEVEYIGTGVREECVGASVVEEYIGASVGGECVRSAAITECPNGLVATNNEHSNSYNNGKSYSNVSFAKYRQYLYEWNKMSDAHNYALSILKLYLKSDINTTNNDIIENNDNFYSLAERLMVCFLKIIKLKTPFINKKDFYTDSNYEIEELDTNGTLWLLRRNVYQILLEGDKIIISNIFLRISIKIILKLLKFFSINNNLDSDMILNVLNSLESKGILGIIMKRLLSKPYKNSSQKDNSSDFIINKNGYSPESATMNTANTLLSSSYSNSTLNSTSSELLYEINMSIDNIVEKKKKRKYYEENKQEIERYWKRKKNSKCRILDSTHLGAFVDELIFLINEQTNNSINVSSVQPMNEYDFYAETKSCYFVHKLFSFYKHTSDNEEIDTSTPYDYYFNIINQIQQKNNSVGNASEIASIFLRGIVLMLTTYILAITNKYEYSKNFVYEPVIPFYNLHAEMSKMDRDEDNRKIVSRSSINWRNGISNIHNHCDDVTESYTNKIPTNKINPFFNTCHNCLTDNRISNKYNSSINNTSSYKTYPNYINDRDSVLENGHSRNYDTMHNFYESNNKLWVPLDSSETPGLIDDLVSNSDDTNLSLCKHNSNSNNSGFFSEISHTKLDSINSKNEKNERKEKNAKKNNNNTRSNNKNKSVICHQYCYNSDDSDEFYVRRKLEDVYENEEDSTINFKAQLNQIVHKMSKKLKCGENGNNGENSKYSQVKKLKELKKIKKKLIQYNNDSKKLNFIFSLLEEILKIMLGVGLRVLSTISHHYLYENNGIFKFIHLFGSKVTQNELNNGEKATLFQSCYNIAKPQNLTLLQSCNFVTNGIIPCLAYVTNILADNKTTNYFYIKELKNYFSFKMALNIWPMFLKITLQSLLTSRNLTYEMSIHKDSLHPLANCCMSITTLATHFLTYFTIMSDKLSIYEIHVNMSKYLKSNSGTTNNSYPIPLILVNAAKYIRIASKKNKYYDFEKAIRTILLQLTDCSVCDYENYVFNHYVLPQSVSSFLSVTKNINKQGNTHNLYSGLSKKIPTSELCGKNVLNASKSWGKTSMQANFIPSGYVDKNCLSNDLVNSNEYSKHMKECEEQNKMKKKKKTKRKTIFNTEEVSNMHKKQKNIEFVYKLMSNDKEAVSFLGTHYNVFHKNFERAQIALVAVFLYLTGYNHSNRTECLNKNYSEHVYTKEQKDDILINEILEIKKIKIACNLARLGVIDLISKSQTNHQKQNNQCASSSSQFQVSDEKQLEKSMEFSESEIREFEEFSVTISNALYKAFGTNKKLNNTVHRSLDELELYKRKAAENKRNKESKELLVDEKKKNGVKYDSNDDIEKDANSFNKMIPSGTNTLMGDVEKNGLLHNTNNNNCFNISNESITVDLIKKKREKQINKIIKKCEWITQTYPFGLCPIIVNNTFSHEWDEQIVFMRRDSYNIPTTIRKIYPDRSDYYIIQEAATVPTFASSYFKTNVSSSCYLEQFYKHKNKIDDKLQCMQFSTENIFNKVATKNMYLLKRLLKTYKRNVSFNESNNVQIKYDNTIAITNDKNINIYLNNRKISNESNSYQNYDNSYYYNYDLNGYTNYNHVDKNSESSDNRLLVQEDGSIGGGQNGSSNDGGHTGSSNDGGHNNECDSHMNGKLWVNNNTLTSNSFAQNIKTGVKMQNDNNMTNYKHIIPPFSFKNNEANSLLFQNATCTNSSSNSSMNGVNNNTICNNTNDKTMGINHLFDYDRNTSALNLIDMHNGNYQQEMVKFGKNTENVSNMRNLVLTNSEEILNNSSNNNTDQTSIGKNSSNCSNSNDGKQNVLSEEYINNCKLFTNLETIPIQQFLDQAIDVKNFPQLNEILNFLIDDINLGTVLKLIRIEQLTFLCRYLIGRSVKSMLCAGIFGEIKNPLINMNKNNNLCLNTCSEMDRYKHNHNSDNTSENKKVVKTKQSIENSNIDSNDNNVNDKLSLHVTSPTLKYKNATLRNNNNRSSSSRNKTHLCKNKNKKAIFELLREKSNKSTQWPVMLDILVPTSSRRGKNVNECNKMLCNVFDPCLFSVQNYGWMLFKLLHIIIIKFRNTTPLQNVLTGINVNNENKPNIINGSNNILNKSGNNVYMVKDNLFCYNNLLEQPMEHALSFTLTDITKSICIWYLKYNRKMIMNYFNFSRIIKNSMNTLWIESILRLISLQICLRVKPLNDSRYVVPFLYHMLTICQPLLREVHLNLEDLRKKILINSKKKKTCLNNKKKKHLGNKKKSFSGFNNENYLVDSTNHSYNYNRVLTCSHCHKAIKYSKLNKNNHQVYIINEPTKNVQKIRSKENVISVGSSSKKSYKNNTVKKNLCDIKGYIHSEQLQKKKKQIKKKVFKIISYNSSENENEHEVVLDNVIIGVVIYHEVLTKTDNNENKEYTTKTKSQILQNLKGFTIKNEYISENNYYALCVQQYKNSLTYTLPLKKLSKYVNYTTDTNICTQSTLDKSNGCYWSVIGEPVCNVYGNAKVISDVQLEICSNKNGTTSTRKHYFKKNNYELDISIKTDTKDVVVNVWVKKKAIVINKEIIECVNNCTTPESLSSSFTNNKKKKQKISKSLKKSNILSQTKHNNGGKLSFATNGEERNDASDSSGCSGSSSSLGSSASSSSFCTCHQFIVRGYERSGDNLGNNVSNSLDDNLDDNLDEFFDSKRDSHSSATYSSSNSSHSSNNIRTLERDAEKDAKKNAEKDTERDAEKDAERDAEKGAENDIEKSTEKSAEWTDTQDNESIKHDVNENLNYKKLKLISWNLIKTVLWGILVSGENIEVDNTDYDMNESNTKYINRKFCKLSDDTIYGPHNYNKLKTEFNSLQRTSLIESVLKMIMSVLIKLCNIVIIYKHLTRNNKKSLYFIIGNIKITQQQVKECEQLINHFMHILINCVQKSATGAVILLKCFLFSQDNPTSHFKKLRTCNINCNLYKLITECIKKAVNHSDEISIFFNQFYNKNILSNGIINSSNSNISNNSSNISSISNSNNNVSSSNNNV
ncbi:hypothetical protein HEP_00313900, partial [Hepatocystis sp. ex Piliocolobus tephrosceles]